MRMQQAVGIVLRYGSVASVLLVIFGLALLVADGGGGGFSIAQISSPASAINTSQFPARGVAAALENLDGLGFVLLGLMVLVATPITRVAVSVIGFIAEGNRLYTTITLIVLIELLVALFLLPTLIAH